MDCRVPILMYHRISDDGPPELAPFRVSCAAFREQIRLLRDRGYYSISVADWTFSIATRRFLPGKPIIITFDDGYKDFVENAWPILEPTGFRAMIFVVTSRVGGVADWDSGAPGSALLDWAELRALQAHGNTIASHCDIHRDLTRRSDEAIAADAEEARGTLRRELGVETTAIAFPWGKSDPRVRRALAKGGYTAGLGIAARASGLSDNPLDLPRIEVFGDDDLAAFARKLGDEPAGAFCAAHPAERETLERLAARVDRLVAELASIKRGLLDQARNPARLEVTLEALFAQPPAGPTRLLPHQAIGPWARLGFEGGAEVDFTVLAKNGERANEGPFPQFLRLSFAGSSRWFSLDLILPASELAGVRRYQLALSARTGRRVDCRAVLRLWQKDRQYREIVLAAFAATPDERNYNLSGEIDLPDPLAIDHDSDPMFLLMFDTKEAIEIDLYYLNLYFS